MMQRQSKLGMALTAGLFGLISTTFFTPVVGEDHGQTDRTTFPVHSAIVKIIDSVNVPAEFSGVLAELNYREGQMVRSGDELARMKNDDLQLRLARAEIENKISQATAENDIDVRFAVKALEVSSSKVIRSQRSNVRVPGVVSAGRLQEQQLEEHRDTLRVEQATRDQKISSMKVELATTDVELTRLILERSSIRSPIDGMIISVSAKPGEWVEPGQPIVRIVRMDRLKIEGFVPAGIASQLRIGDPASAVINQEWLKGTSFDGKVVFINPEANPVNSSVQIWVEIDNRELKLIPGLEANLTVEYQQR